MKDDIKDKIRQFYTTNVIIPLRPYIGKYIEGKLNEGLEKMLNYISNVTNGSFDEEFEPDILGGGIDYKAIEDISNKMGFKSVPARITSSFENEGIKTYGDLVKRAELDNEKESYDKGYKKGKMRKIHIMNIGNQSLKVLYNDLNSKGINIFGTPYTEKELKL